MWVFLSDAFLSIVEPDPATGKDELLVRARFRGDIRRVFRIKEEYTPEKDYAFRALVPRDEVIAAMTAEVKLINYPNFKNSVIGDDRHAAYSRVWTSMFMAQQKKTPRVSVAHLPDDWGALRNLGQPYPLIHAPKKTRRKGRAGRQRRLVV